MSARILAPCGYVLGAASYLVARADGRVIVRALNMDHPECWDEPIGWLTDDDSIAVEPADVPPALLSAVYRRVGPMGLGVVQYHGGSIDGRRVWSRVKEWPGGGGGA